MNQLKKLVLPQTMAQVNVEEWLRHLYATNTKTGSKFNCEAPSFEKTKTTMEILSELKLANCLADQQVEEEIKIAKFLQEEHGAEANRLSNILKPLGLDISSLPCDLYSLAGIISSADKHAEQLENRSLDRINECTDLTAKQMQALQRLQNLEKVRASLNDLSITENQEQIGKKKEAEFLSKKINEYAANIRHFEKRLETVDFQAEVRHGNLEKKYEDWKLIRDKLTQIRSKLSAYSDLTPDINLARVQVQQLKEELAQMENQITDNISNINAK